MVVQISKGSEESETTSKTVTASEGVSKENATATKPSEMENQAQYQTGGVSRL
jgi:hypothetical protein